MANQGEGLGDHHLRTAAEVPALVEGDLGSIGEPAQMRQHRRPAPPLDQEQVGASGIPSRWLEDLEDGEDLLALIRN